MNTRKISQTFSGTANWIIPGSYFKLLESVLAVDVELVKAGQQVASLQAVEGGTYLRTEFDEIRITSASSQAIAFLVAPDEGGSDRFTIENLQADTLTNVGAVTVGLAEVVALAASASRKVIYFRARTGNTADIILGAAGVIATGGGIRLSAGQEKVVEVAAAAAWSAISTAAAQTLDILSAA